MKLKCRFHLRSTARWSSATFIRKKFVSLFRKTEAETNVHGSPHERFVSMVSSVRRLNANPQGLNFGRSRFSMRSLSSSSSSFLPSLTLLCFYCTSSTFPIRICLNHLRPRHDSNTMQELRPRRSSMPLHFHLASHLPRTSIWACFAHDGILSAKVHCLSHGIVISYQLTGSGSGRRTPGICSRPICGNCTLGRR